MATKVNGIKIYPKHSLGAILCASFGVFAGFMIIISLTFFPILGATINGTLMQVNAFDYLTYAHIFEAFGLDSLSNMSGFTHFLAPNKYNYEFFTYLDSFRNGASSTENYAVFWYGSASGAFDAILGASYILMMFFGLFLFIEGIVRLATGTFHKTAKPFTIVCFFLMLLFLTSSFFTNFCAKYLALELMEEGATYDPKVCPMQYILFFILLACWIVQHCIYNSMIKGKLYVADARLIKGQKELKKRKKTRRSTKEEVIPEEEVIAEEVPAEQLAPLEAAPAPEPVKAEEQPKQEATPARKTTIVEEQSKPEAASEVKPNEEPKVEANKEEAKKTE